MLKLATCAALFFFLNFVTARLTLFNPMYCWGGYLIGPIWRAYSEVIFLCAIGFFIVAMFTGWHRVPLAIGAMVLISSAPTFAHILSGGGACL